MSKKQCLNFLLSSSTQEPLSLSSLTPFTQISQELKLKPSIEITGKIHKELEKKSITLESENLSEAYNTWLRSIGLKLSLIKLQSEKVLNT